MRKPIYLRLSPPCYRENIRLDPHEQPVREVEPPASRRAYYWGLLALACAWALAYGAYAYGWRP